MTVMRTRPLALARDFEALFGAAFDAPRTWIPRVDVYEVEGALSVRAELPGFSAEDLDVSLEDGVLTLSGTRSFADAENVTYHRRELAEGGFSRTIRVGDAYDPESVEAVYRDGILTVTLTKRPEVLPRKIEITTA